MSERFRARLTFLRFGSDLILTESALLLAVVSSPLLSATSQAHPGLAVYLLVAMIWSVALLLSPLYRARDRRAGDETQSLFLVITLATLALAGVLFFTFPHVSRLQILTFYALDLAFLIGSRLLVRLGLRLVDKPRYDRRKVLIVGAGPVGCDTVHMIERHRWTGLELAGFLDDDLPPGTEVEGYPVLGRVEEVARVVEAEGIEEIVVALSVQAYDRFFRLLDGMKSLPARVRIVPDHIKMTLFRTVAEEFAGVPMITLRQPTLDPFERRIKRAFDLIVGSLLLILLSPVLLLVAIAVRLDSPGPVIFKQRRVGEKGKIFWMYKFRSMIQGAEQQQFKTVRVREDGRLLYKHPNDPRVTRVGRFIRRTSLDELPQLINVLKGEMSLVGPRPELPWLVEQYEPWQWQRFSVPQGITGWWQVNGRSDKPMHLYTDEDLFYIQNYSFLLDLQILWHTVGAVLKSKGAY